MYLVAWGGCGMVRLNIDWSENSKLAINNWKTRVVSHLIRNHCDSYDMYTCIQYIRGKDEMEHVTLQWGFGFSLRTKIGRQVSRKHDHLTAAQWTRASLFESHQLLQSTNFLPFGKPFYGLKEFDIQSLNRSWNSDFQFMT